MWSITNVSVTIVLYFFKQNIQLLIEEKDGCWVVDRAVVFVAEGGWIEPHHPTA